MDRTLQRIDEIHPSYMSLHYLLLFPYGTVGGSPDIPRMTNSKTSKSTIALREFYAFRIQHRVGESIVIKNSSRLGKQFYIDAWAVIEQYRLTWNQNYQGRLWKKLHNGIQDVISAIDIIAESTRWRYILSSSFTGGHAI